MRAASPRGSLPNSPSVCRAGSMRVTFCALYQDINYANILTYYSSGLPDKHTGAYNQLVCYTIYNENRVAEEGACLTKSAKELLYLPRRNKFLPRRLHNVMNRTRTGDEPNFLYRYVLRGLHCYDIQCMTRSNFSLCHFSRCSTELLPTSGTVYVPPTSGQTNFNW